MISQIDVETSSSDNRRTIVDLVEIHKSYGSHKVLKDVSLKAVEGSVTALIGSSGSGKSTLLRCINLLEVPSQGRVIIEGEEVRLAGSKDGPLQISNPAQLRRLRRKLGMVFQSFNLWPHLTVIENVIEAPVHVFKESKIEALVRAEELLSKVGLFDKRNAYPAFLSGGQQQRAAIARALAIQPAAMLFDEPTSALDPELVGEVMRVIRQLAHEGTTMILVTHEMAFAREVADHVMFLHGGRVEEAGPPAKVFGDPVSERCRQFVRPR